MKTTISPIIPILHHLATNLEAMAIMGEQMSDRTNSLEVGIGDPSPGAALTFVALRRSGGESVRLVRIDFTDSIRFVISYYSFSRDGREKNHELYCSLRTKPEAFATSVAAAEIASEIAGWLLMSSNYQPRAIKHGFQIDDVNLHPSEGHT